MRHATHPLSVPCPLPVRRDRLPRNHRLPTQLRFGLQARDDAPGDVPFARPRQVALLEAALYLSEEPVPPRRLISLLGLKDAGELRVLVKRLHELFEAEGSAYQVEEIAGGFQLLTREAFHHWLLRFHGSDTELKLSPAGKETLAIIAYRQPIMRAEVEAIRGVQCGDVLRMLMEKQLIRICGRDDSLGRPVLYGTTRKLLQVLGLRTVKDLPQWSELRKEKDG